MNRQYTLRLFFVGSLLFLGYAIIAGRLFFIQIYNARFFSTLGQKQYDVTVTQTPPRAPIFDRNGCPLALNKDSFAAFTMPKKLEDVLSLKRFLKHSYPQAYKKLITTEPSHFMYIKRRLTPQQRKNLEKETIKDIYILNEPSRFYPLLAAAPLIGLTDIDNKGIVGLELFHNKQLAGSPSVVSLLRDARSGSFYFERATKVQGSSGNPITTTIDSTLQFLVYEAVRDTVATFTAKEGAALIINPINGDILAMASVPCFDPNDTETLDLEQTKNKPITEVYELGSVIKAFLALAALEEGVVTPDEMIDCENKFTTYIDGRRVNTARTTSAGLVPFTTVIRKSNNIGVAKVALRLGEKLYDYYRRLGLGSKTGVDFPGERDGFVNPPSAWSKQSILSLSYGYEINCSLLQLARAFGIIATEGFDVRPHLILNNPVPGQKERLFSSASCRALKAILTSEKPTPGTIKPYIEGIRIGSKTGTANILINGKYDETKNLFTCAGFVEKGNYSRIIVTFIKESAHKRLLASQVAAPLFQDIAQKLVIHDAVIQNNLVLPLATPNTKQQKTLAQKETHDTH
jgi:cell division protein FtsI (penicillin-binding protein 3)